MRGCRIGERGAFALISQLLVTNDQNGDVDDKGNDHHKTTGTSNIKQCCGLREIDMSCNKIGFIGVFAIEKGLKLRMDRIQRSITSKRSNNGGFNTKSNHDSLESYVIEVDLEGNLIFQEVMNCVTHGVGILLAVLATLILSREVKGHPRAHVISCAIYSTSLIVLYLSSTLYHSFFALQRTRNIFEVFDKCSIYLLIAGSYTPFFTVVVPHPTLITFIWVFGVSGVFVEAFAPLWKYRGTFSLAMYLGQLLCSTL